MELVNKDWSTDDKDISLKYQNIKIKEELHKLKNDFKIHSQMLHRTVEEVKKMKYYKRIEK